jgi:hypothetical protein
MCSTITVSPGPGDEPWVPLDELEEQICALAADLAAATCRWLDLVAQYDARDGWREWGVNSCAHWLSWRVGIGLTAAREQTRVARALGALPRVHAHFASGELTYSKVRAITRVAQPETEADLVEIARHATGAQLEELCRGYAGVIRATREHAQIAEEKQNLTCLWGDDGMLRIEGRLTAEDGAALLSALEAVQSDDASVPVGIRRAQALANLVTGEDARPAEVVVHVDAQTLDNDQITERCEIESGPTIAPEIARRLGCDASLVTIIERDGQPLSVGRKTRAIYPALRRALKSRDGGCRFPGCTHTRYLHAHHIEHWIRGGATELTNLIQLCSHHHHLVHEGGFTVEVDPTGTPRFRNRHGHLIPPAGEGCWATDVPIDVQNDGLGIDVDSSTCRPRSAGDRLDYGIAVEGLARKWLPPPG